MAGMRYFSISRFQKLKAGRDGMGDLNEEKWIEGQRYIKSPAELSAL